MAAGTKSGLPYLQHPKYNPNEYFCPCCQESVMYVSRAKAKEARCEYCGTPIRDNHIKRIGKTIKPSFVRVPESNWWNAIMVWRGYKLPKMRLKMQFGIDVTEAEKKEYAKTHEIK